MQENTDQSHNIAHYLPAMAAAFPTRRAVVFPASRDSNGRALYTHLSFRELDEACDRYAWGLVKVGVQPRMRVLLMVRPCLDFYPLTFALFKIGAVPVLIDPGMGWRSFMRCVSRTAPQGLIGTPAAHLMRLLFPSAFRSVTIRVSLGRRGFPGVCSVNRLPSAGGAFQVQAVVPDETAAVLFTTGSTGPAKGVVYTHQVFTTQTEILRRRFNITPDDVDLPCFPLFGLFSTALGATAVIPDMNPSRPALVDPERIVEAITDNKVTYSFGSPALWDRVSAYCVEREIKLPSLTRILMAGAPIPGYLHERLLQHVLCQGAETHTPYGATESLPVADLSGAEMLAETREKTRRGAGMCVGRPVPEITFRVITMVDGAIPEWSEDLTLGTDEIGEFAVKGPMVTRAYDRLPLETGLAKIKEGDQVWHRMGDVGYCDRKGRIWYCGRKAHRVVTADRTLFTTQCEAIFNEHPRVYRSALVGIGSNRYRQTAVVVIEPRPGEFPRGRTARNHFAEELLELGSQADLTRSIRHVLFKPSFPVDIRHNAKIRREIIAAWASRRLSKEASHPRNKCPT